MLELFIKGGPIMWPLLILSIITVAVAIERFFFAIRTPSGVDGVELKEMMSSLKYGDKKKAIELGSQSKSKVANIISEGLSSASFEDAISNSANQYIAKFDEGQTILDTAITLSPLLGLLGTVTGMIKSFGLLGASELGAPTAITGGIAEALIATAFGLAIAIFALLPFNLIQSKKEKFIRELETKAGLFFIQLKQDSIDKLEQEAA